ncbi:hypothetical protein C8Q75DRAFT_51338 [Abortiporus biennis]|nr:hypothetical protein C8Q75DRAFT_51338 [Abortiporus biennis]
MATATPSLPSPPNPLTPLAWLPPDISSEMQNANYIVSASVGAWACNYLMSLPEEYQMFSKSIRSRSLGIPDVCYILARLVTLALLTSTFVFLAHPVENCEILLRFVDITGALAMPINSLLLFYRIRAVFFNHRIVVWGFFLLWLSTLCSLVVLINAQAIHIGPTFNCIELNFRTYNSIGFLLIAINDTLVYLAISAQLTWYIGHLAPSRRFRTFFSGEGYGHVTRILLKGGQVYYLATASVNIFTMAFGLAPSTSPVYRAIIPVVNIGVQNAMACMVFRQIKLGILEGSETIMLSTQLRTEVSESSESTGTRSFLKFRTYNPPNRTVTVTVAPTDGVVASIAPSHIQFWNSGDVQDIAVSGFPVTKESESDVDKIEMASVVDHHHVS